MAGNEVYQLARRATLLKSATYQVALKSARNKETCRTHAWYIRFYYSFIKRPSLRIYIPLRNWVMDYVYVSKDWVKFAREHPVKGIIYWTGFFVAIYAFWTKPDLDDFRRDVREANSLVAPSAPFGMNERSKCFLEETNAAIGRHQIVPMNFMIFTLFYRNKFDTKVFNPVSTCDNVNLGFLEKLKATVEIGAFGEHWFLRWHKSDIDIPEKNMFGEQMRDTIRENMMQEIYRRLVLSETKYKDLTVAPRFERHERAVGLKSIESVNT